MIDLDSFIGELDGYQKQGAGLGYTGERGYQPLLATRSGTGEALHVRQRKGQAGSGRCALLRLAAGRPRPPRRCERRDP